MKKISQKFSLGYFVAAFLLLSSIIAFAAVLLYFTQNKTTQFEKKTIFRSDMELGVSAVAIGPGESTAFAPYVHNDATEKMYVFLKVTMPVVDNENLYEFTADANWTEVENGEGYAVYAYVDAASNMCELDLDETTPTLTTQITMKNISNALYAGIDDINVSVDSYAISCDGASTNPQEAWMQCVNAEGGN